MGDSCYTLTMEENQDIVFETDSANVSVSSRQQKSILDAVIRFSGGYIQNQTQAAYLLGGFALVALLLSLLLFTFGGPPKARGPIPHGTSLTVPG